MIVEFFIEREVEFPSEFLEWGKDRIWKEEEDKEQVQTLENEKHWQSRNKETWVRQQRPIVFQTAGKSGKYGRDGGWLEFGNLETTDFPWPQFQLYESRSPGSQVGGLPTRRHVKSITKLKAIVAFWSPLASRAVNKERSYPIGRDNGP